MQVLYLLKTEDWTLFKMRTLGTDVLSNAAFSPDSRFLLLGLCCHLGSVLEIYDSNGQVLCVLTDQGGDLPSHAFLGNDRLALTYMHTFRVYDTCSGQLQATIGPRIMGPTSTDYEMNYEPLISVNPLGSMLAFCIARGTTFHIFDTVTLQELGCIYSAGGKPMLHDFNPTGLLWGPYGWVLFQRPSVSNNVMASEQVRVVTPLSGSDMYTEVLRCDNQPQHAPACSPDGSLVCICSSSHGSIEIYDTRSGQLKVRQPVCMPAYEPGEKLGQVIVNWSGCGRWLLAKVFVSKDFSTWLKLIQLVTLYS